MRRTRKKSLIMAVARPAYPSTITVEAEQLSRGDRGGSVRPLQLLLIGYGYSCGGSGADGIFGLATENAVTCFQEDNDLTPDGIVGPDTMGSLLGC
jgi:peptidoglycan hydrolase-like protein with peptidoglycan-binding domain